MTSAALGEKLGIERAEVTVSNWRRGKTRPRFTQIRQIGEALTADDDWDPLTLQRAMGVLGPRAEPRDLYDAADRLQQLRDDLAHTARSSGAGNIVNAAIATGRWAVGVYPVVVGGTHPIHVADHLEFRHANSDEIAQTQDVWNDDALRPVFRENYARTSRRWPRWTRESVEVSEKGALWSINRLASPRNPRTRVTGHQIDSVAVLGLTTEGWTDDIAGILAAMLGFGLITTRALAIEVYELVEGATKSLDRAGFHQHLIREPPVGRVWSHQAPRSVGPLLPTADQQPNDRVAYVWLTENNSQLQAASAKWRHSDGPGYAVGRLAKDAAQVEAEIDAARTAGHTVYLEHADTDKKGYEDGRWEGCRETALRILNALIQGGRIDRALIEALQKQAIDGHGDELTAPILRWTHDRWITSPPPDPEKTAQ